MRSGRDLILPRRRIQTLGRLRGARQGIVFKSERTPKCWGQVENSGDNFAEAKQVSDIAARFERGRVAALSRYRRRSVICPQAGAKTVERFKHAVGESCRRVARLGFALRPQPCPSAWFAAHGCLSLGIGHPWSKQMRKRRDVPVACPWMPEIAESGHPWRANCNPLGLEPCPPRRPAPS
jgi:hypothetical protein